MNEDTRRLLDSGEITPIPYMKLGKGGTVTAMDGTLIATLNTADWNPEEIHAFAVCFMNAPLILSNIGRREEENIECKAR
jgi:hypothetical protein